MHMLRKSIALLVAASALMLAVAGVASATTVTVSPGGNVTGTGSNWQLTLNTARRTFNCSNAGFTATLSSNVRLSTNYQQTFSSCRLSGGISYTDTCAATGTLTVTGLTSAGVTPISLTGLSCVISVSGSCRVNLSGSVQTSYTNASNLLTVLLSGQSIALTGSTCATLPNESSATFSNSSGGAFVYSVSPGTTINAV